MEALLVAAAGSMIYADGQLEYNGFLLGDDEDTFTESIVGWDDLPGVDSGNTLRSNSHGGWSGNKFSGMRVITWEGRFSPADPETWAKKIKALRHALSLPIGTVEYPIVIRSHDEVLMSFGAVVARSIPMDRQYSYYGAKLAVQFSCADPRRYSLGEHTWSLKLPDQVEVGLAYPLSYPLNYGEEVTSSFASLFNDGDVVTPVSLIFTGPVYRPSIVNQTRGARLEFDISLGSDEFLEVNTRTGAVMLNGNSDRLYTRTATSAPILSFGLMPGQNDMLLTAESWGANASANITWRDATL